ncbi:hypothetical protein H310_06907 [Aphanomyces invadans]|uniref:Uncharacterized protein n=1 Tax=Aphanomyces invadans TaxID=157072 RepID=A0A024U526_9STRA|nr:hypothetical protein H310_06907 [Aphanomyces invadans]ETW01349.1 hypothetical protein H310_06907 [Aphanomyces invadans]|eukprot:XP_008870347.1 hypothetical protein H310_06907 [Aphanomyces invadans]
MSFVRAIVRQFSGDSSIETIDQKLEAERLQRLELLKVQKEVRHANAMYRGGGSTLQDDLLRRSHATGQRHERMRQDSNEWETRSREGSYEMISRNGSFDFCEDAEPDVEPHGEPCFVVIHPPVFVDADQTADDQTRTVREDKGVGIDATAALVQPFVEDLIDGAVAQCVLTKAVKACAVDYTNTWLAVGSSNRAIRSTLAIQLVRSSIDSAMATVANQHREATAMAAEDVTMRHKQVKAASPVNADFEIKCRHTALATEALAAFYAARAQKKLLRSQANRGAEARKLREMSAPTSSWAKVLQLIDDPTAHPSYGSMQAPVSRMFNVLRTSAA